ncbi:MAG: FecR domain-containing protein, partial [Gammaproteobacteria bacterium]|nr:FecR domain-containing protein [Gammaproteobacteria bacterium]
GGPVLNNEEYRTGTSSNALLVFKDGGRVSMKEESVFRVENYEFDEATPEDGDSSLRLIQGGLRALTGTISDANPDAYEVNTSVATIGIRGTGFDLVWAGPCVSGATNCGLIASVWLGGIFSENDAGTQDINLNQTARIPNLGQLPEFINTPPVFVIPRPDQVDIDMEELFAALTGRDAEPGLFVACYEGHCSLEDDDSVVDLGNGETGFAAYQGGERARVTRIEPFQQEDRYLRAIDTTYDTLFEIQDDRIYILTEFQCVIR